MKSSRAVRRDRHARVVGAAVATQTAIAVPVGVAAAVIIGLIAGGAALG